MGVDMVVTVNTAENLLIFNFSSMPRTGSEVIFPFAILSAIKSNVILTVS